MKKIKVKGVMIILLILLVSVNAYCQELELGNSLNMMKVTFNLPAGSCAMPVSDQTDVIYQVAFCYPDSKYEVRVGFYPISYIQGQTYDENIDKFVPIFILRILWCIAKENIHLGKMSEFTSKSAYQEFGADHGFTALLKGGNSDFCKSYEYIVVNVLYKKNSGIVIVYFLCNDSDDLDLNSIEFYNAYYCFAFNS